MSFIYKNDGDVAVVSKEAVAYALLLGIAKKQDKLYAAAGALILNADEEWVFKMYEKCLIVASGGAASLALKK